MSSHRNWIVVANSARARVIELGDIEGVCRELVDLVHPESRLKGVERAALHGGDRPGHVEGTGHGLGSASYQPASAPTQTCESTAYTATMTTKPPVSSQVRSISAAPVRAAAVGTTCAGTSDHRASRRQTAPEGRAQRPFRTSA